MCVDVVRRLSIYALESAAKLHDFRRHQGYIVLSAIMADTEKKANAGAGAGGLEALRNETVDLVRFCVLEN